MCKEVEPLLDLLEAHISFPSVCVCQVIDESLAVTPVLVMEKC